MSTAVTCPHCSSAIPAEFSSMPICYICGGDLKAAPSAPVWSSVDIRTDNTRTCKKCGESIKSVLALSCPNCGADVPPPGAQVDAEEEKKKFEDAVTASNKKVDTPPPVQQAPQPTPQPVQQAQPVREPVKEPVREEPKAEPVKEGLFAKILRMLGLKK
ncbi:MAG: zinc ribbon domain-containing protein [Candidatus Sericytochromatia bacterium]